MTSKSASVVERGERPLLPAAFQSSSVTRWLNVAAVGLSLAALSTAAAGRLLDGGRALPDYAVIAGLPTLVFGIAWAILFRRVLSAHAKKLRWGWVVSVPLAALSAGVVAALSQALRPEGGLDPVKGLLSGLTLLFAVLAYGLPMALVRRRGIAREDLVETVIAGIAASIAALTLWQTMIHVKDPVPLHHPLVTDIGRVLVWVYGGLGIGVGVLNVLVGRMREQRRREFLEQVEGGQIEGLRVDPLAGGKVLVRVQRSGETYRTSDGTDVLLAFDEEGNIEDAIRADDRDHVARKR